MRPADGLGRRAARLELLDVRALRGPAMSIHAPRHVIDALRQLERDAARRGLRPIVDPDLHLVRCDCAACGAGGTWSPVRLVPRGRTVHVLCDACGLEEEHRA
jgi:hypothetical protein